MQTFLGQSRWKTEAILDEHQRQTGELLGDANGVMILDGSDCAKQGSNSVGVQRQWCGELGKTANGQAGVYVGYSSCHGYSLLDGRFYLPEIFVPYVGPLRPCLNKPNSIWVLIIMKHALDSVGIII